MWHVLKNINQLSPTLSPFFRSLRSISGCGTNDVWAVGSNGFISHWNGDSWSEIDSGTGVILSSVLAWDIDNAWAVGDNGTILHWNGSEWIQEYFDNQNYLKIWGTSPDNMWMCGDGKLHWNGSGWTTEDTTNGCRDIWGASEDDVWAVGDGYVGHWDGQSWARFPGGLTNEEIEDVFAEDDSNIWAVGDSAVLYRNGEVWFEMAHGRAGQNNNAVWAARPDDAWVVGDGGHISHWDGTTWSAVSSGTASDLRSIWGSRADSIWAVGEQGTILHWNGSVWMPVVSGTRETLLKVHGSSDENVWAAGEYSTLLRWDSHTWYPAEFGLDYCEGIQDLLVFSPDDVWIAIGVDVYNWDGSQWSQEISGNLFGVRLGGVATDNVWVFSYGAPGCCIGNCPTPGVYNRNGFNWSEDIQPDLAYYFYWVQDVAVTEQGSVIVIGDQGEYSEEPTNVMISHWGW